MSKKCCFTGPPKSNMVRGTKNCWNLNHTTFTIFIAHCEVNSFAENCFSVIWKVLKMFVNILTADDKFSLLNRDNLRQPIQMQLSQKKKHFLNLFLQFWKLDKILNIFNKRMTFIVAVFPTLWTQKNVVNQISKKSNFIRFFAKQHVKGSKYCWNRNHTTCTILLNHCDPN